MSAFTRFVLPASLALATLALLPAQGAMQKAATELTRGVQGAWYPVRTEQKLPGMGWKLEVFDSHFVVSHTRTAELKKAGDSIDIVMYRAPYRVETKGRSQTFVPTKESMGISAITLHLEGDRLIIDEGTCGNDVSLKGEWSRKRP